MSKKQGVFAQLADGLVAQNPVLVQLLGMCPTLATSTSVKNGLGMGIAATAVLICSNIAISMLRKIIPEKVRIACYIVVIAGFVTCVDLLLQAFVPALSKSLGVFIPLIVVNCIIFARAEAFANRNSVFRSAIDGLGMGLGFTFALPAGGLPRYSPLRRGRGLSPTSSHRRPRKALFHLPVPSGRRPACGPAPFPQILPCSQLLAG